MRNREKARLFQESELRPYAELSYEELLSLKGRQAIESPQGLGSFNFAREIKNDEFGGLEVSVFYYWVPDSSKYPKVIQGIMAEHGVKQVESRSSAWFNISPQGRIEWPEMDQQDGED